jgi:hypothetical protein
VSERPVSPNFWTEHYFGLQIIYGRMIAQGLIDELETISLKTTSTLKTRQTLTAATKMLRQFIEVNAPNLLSDPDLMAAKARFHAREHPSPRRRRAGTSKPEPVPSATELPCSCLGEEP